MALTPTARGGNISTANNASLAVSNVAAGALLVVACGGNEEDNSPVTTTVSDTTGLTWTLRASATVSGAASPVWSGKVYIYTAQVGGSIISPTITAANSQTMDGTWLHVMEYSGHDAANPVGATATGTRQETTGSWTITLSAGPASDSEVVAAGTIDNYVNSNVWTNGTGWTQRYENSISETHAHVQTRTGSTSTSVTWDNADAETGDDYGFGAVVAVEIKAASAGGTDDLTADDVSAGTPTVGSPSIGQVHALGANDVAAQAPTVGSPALGQTHVITAEDIQSGAPSVSSPTMGQEHALTADSISSGVPGVSEPALGVSHVLSADGVSSGAPTVGTPALGQEHALLANDIGAGTPSVSSPDMGQTHALVADDVASGTPTLSAPSLADIAPGTDVLLADDIASGVPTLSNPVLGIIAATEIQSGGSALAYSYLQSLDPRRKRLTAPARKRLTAKARRRVVRIIELGDVETVAEAVDETRAEIAPDIPEVDWNAIEKRLEEIARKAFLRRQEEEEDEEDAVLLLLH